MRCLGVPICLLLLLLGSPIGTAAAAPKPEQVERARHLYVRGLQLFKEGYYEQAIDAWLESWKISGREELLFNLAGAYERLGRLPDARDVLVQYRDLAPEGEVPTLDLRINNLERRIAEQNAITEIAMEPSRRGPGRVIAIAGLGTATVAASGVGLWAGLSARTAHNEGLEFCSETAEGLLCESQADPLLERERNMALVADLSWGTAAVTLVGASLLVTDLAVRGTSTQLTVGAAPGGAMLKVRW